MEAEDVAILDRVSDRVFVQASFEQGFGGAQARLLALDLLIASVFLENRRAGEAEQLCPGEELLDRLVVLTELRAMAFVEDEGDALVCQWGQPRPVIAPVAAIERQAQLLDGGDHHLVGVIVRQQAANESVGIGIFLDATGLKPVELLARLPI